MLSLWNVLSITKKLFSCIRLPFLSDMVMNFSNIFVCIFQFVSENMISLVSRCYNIVDLLIVQNFNFFFCFVIFAELYQTVVVNFVGLLGVYSPRNNLNPCNKLSLLKLETSILYFCIEETLPLLCDWDELYVDLVFVWYCYWWSQNLSYPWCYLVLIFLFLVCLF